MNQMISLKDFQQKCREKLAPQIFGYYVSGADKETTLKNNENYFRYVKLMPRVLRDISKIQLKTTFLGKPVDLPFGIAPFAMQKLVHPRGQLLSASQASQRNVPYTLSMLSTTSMSEVSNISPHGIKIFQLYLLKNAQYTKKIIQQAQKNGFHALALTVDTQCFGKRRLDERNKFNPDVTLEIFKQLEIDIRFRSEDTSKSFINCLDNNVDWKKVAYMKTLTKMPIILKGIVDPEDAIKAHQHGVDAIWISNHGGRQLDSSPATTSVIKPIKDALRSVNSKIPVFVDGGVRTGADIFKQLALGADFVFLGRGFLYSLIDGKQGISKSFNILKQSLIKTMQLCGVTSVSQINQQYVYVYPQAKL